MHDQIDQLEDRIGRTIDQIRRLAGERDALRIELHDVRDELVQRDQAARAAAADAGEPIDRDTVLATLRSALVELRAE